ncbi:MAG TPA: hypothetical protein VLZ84_10660 [Asticcacaulis sp.]|nr:hypothetical protein [Asticcacaulis sp.]
MTTEHRDMVRRLNAFLCVCVVALFFAMTHVNFLDNLQHVTTPGNHEHSVVSLLDTHHDGQGIDTHHEDADTDADDDATGSEHNHPNLCGAALTETCPVTVATNAYGKSADLSWKRFDRLPNHLALALERPPKPLA